MTRSRAANFAALIILWISAVTGTAVAQDVTLQSRDGAINLAGTLLGFDGELYRIDTVYGEMTVDGSGVTCIGPGCPSLTKFVAEIRISGSATMGSVLMPALVESFGLRNGMTTERIARAPGDFSYILRPSGSPDVVAQLHFRVTNTDQGFADLLANQADVVMALREVRDSEVVLAREIGLGNLRDANRSRVLALDALLPVVAPSNPVSTISVRDLARVLSGEVTNWSQLGGVDAPITVHLRDAQSGLSQSAEDRLLGPENLQLQAPVLRHESNAALDRAVARDPFALGVSSYSETNSAKALVLASPCGIALSGTHRTIKTEDYPLTAPMFLYLPARRLPKLGRDFLSFLRSAPAQIVIRRAGFVDQAPEEIPINLQGERFVNAISVAEGEKGLEMLQRMAARLTPMKRLTTTFRFEPGSARLDAQSRSNVQQLARALEAGQYDNRQLLFVGFSDGQGPASGNLNISQRRAAAVRDAVVNAAETANLPAIDMDAYGEIMPMACDDSVWGRQVNRRVEVWVR